MTFLVPAFSKAISRRVSLPIGFAFRTTPVPKALCLTVSPMEYVSPDAEAAAALAALAFCAFFWAVLVWVESRSAERPREKPEVLPLPKLTLNLRWYFDIDVVKDVMNLQAGVNAIVNTRWYAPAYSPDMGQFYNQVDEQYGMIPYCDVFINVQWKRASIYVKYLNAFYKVWDHPEYSDEALAFLSQELDRLTQDGKPVPVQFVFPIIFKLK